MINDDLRDKAEVGQVLAGHDFLSPHRACLISGMVVNYK